MFLESHKGAVMIEDANTTNSELASWLKSPWYSVDEAMNLIMGFAPSTYRFDYAKEQDMPDGSIPIYRALIQAIRDFKLPIHIRNMAITNEEAILLLNESFQENVVSYDEYLHSCWWHDGKLSKHQLIEWLEGESISSEFFNIPQKSQILRSTSTGSRKDIDRINATRKICEEVIAEISHEQHGFQVNNEYKTNWESFAAAVQAKLGAKPHRDAAREEWKKVDNNIKHTGRKPDQ